MVSSLKVGKRRITPKRAKDSMGKEGIFLYDKDWQALMAELKISFPPIKEGVLEGTLRALDEVELFLQGKKKLKNAEQAIRQL